MMKSTPLLRRIIAALALGLPSCAGHTTVTPALPIADARAIAKEAWLYSYAPLQGYATFYTQAVDKTSPGYVGGFNRFRHYARMSTPADTDIVTPNNDTPYSWAWLDLRAEPMVLSLPAVPAPRYYVNQWFDLHTHNFAYTGVRATGREAGNYLFVGPRWKGETPKGITKTFYPETEFIGTLTRTSLAGADDVTAMQALQAQYKLAPLSEFTGQPAPKAAPPIDWPVWNADKGTGIGFIGYMNALLPMMPTVPAEEDAMQRFARIGMGPNRPFDPDNLDPATRAAIEQGIADGQKELQDFAVKQKDSRHFFGTRAELGSNYIINRSTGAMLGIYGNSKQEAVYASQQTEPSGALLDGRKRWLLRFEPGQLPPVDLFWSITMYNLPQRLLVDNAINRYSIGDRTEGLKFGADGSLEIYLQNENPGPDNVSNWLPAPSGPFYFVGRFYGPRATAIDGQWSLPPLIERK